MMQKAHAVLIVTTMLSLKSAKAPGTFSHPIGGLQGGAMEKAGIGFAIILLVTVTIALWSRPACTTGFIPAFTPLDGWVCLAGYKP
jgi:hypothetical protein